MIICRQHLTKPSFMRQPDGLAYVMLCTVSKVCSIKNNLETLEEVFYENF